MKKIYVGLLSIGLLTFTACKKTEDPTANNFYNNKILTLTIEQAEIDAADFVQMRIAAVRVGTKPLPNAQLIVNGKEIEEKYVDINTEMVEDGVITIETKDSAWQFVIDYNFRSNSSPYSISLTPAFNGVSQEGYHFWVSTSTPYAGTLEIKEYTP